MDRDYGPICQDYYENGYYEDWKVAYQGGNDNKEVLPTLCQEDGLAGLVQEDDRLMKALKKGLLTHEK